MTCKQCGEKFHACFSCGLIGWEWDYCTESCYVAAGSPKYCSDCEGLIDVPYGDGDLCAECLNPPVD